MISSWVPVQDSNDINDKLHIHWYLNCTDMSEHDCACLTCKTYRKSLATSCTIKCPCRPFLLQVHTGTSSNASPENVSVFVGSDLTNSVTAPCVDMVIPLVTGFHTHAKSHLAQCFISAKRISTTDARHAGEKILISQSSSQAYCTNRQGTVEPIPHVGVQSVIH